MWLWPQTGEMKSRAVQVCMGEKLSHGMSKLKHGLLKGRVEMVPCGSVPASLGTTAWSRFEQGIPSTALSHLSCLKS